MSDVYAGCLAGKKCILCNIEDWFQEFMDLFNQWLAIGMINHLTLNKQQE